MAQIHSQRIIQRVEFGLFVRLPRRRLLRAVHLRLVDDLDVEIAQGTIHLRQAFGRDKRLGQSFVNVIESQIALFARQPNQVLDLFAQIGAGLALDCTKQLLGVGQRGIRQKSRLGFRMVAGRKPLRMDPRRGG